MRSSSRLVWQPAACSALTSVKRLTSNIRLQTDFGSATPAQRPATSKGLLYVTEPASRKGSFGRYMHTARDQAPYIAGAVAGVCIYSAATLAIPAGFGALIDYASKGEMPLGTSMQLLGWFGMCAVGNYLRLYCIGYAGENIIAKLRRALYHGILRQPTAFFDSTENRTGALVQRLSMDCNVVGSSLTEAVTSGSKNFLQTVGAVGVMLYYSPLLTSVIVCMIPPVAIFAGSYGRYVRKLQHHMQDALADMGTVAEERLSSIRTVRAFGTEVQEVAWYGKNVQRVFDLSLRMVRWNSVYVASLQTVGYGAMYCIMWAGSMLVASGQLTPGVLFSFMLYTVYCGIGLMGLTNLATEINKGYGASLRLFDILDKADALKKAQDAGKQLTPTTCDWRVTLKDVSFAYPTRPEALIYTNINLTVQPSRCTCVVGSSGSGKSSLAMLLLKLYEPTSGEVLLGDYNVRDIQSQWLHERVGYVGQEPVLFGGSIAQNIAYGVPGRNWDDSIDRWQYAAIVEAARKANAHDFISALPEGYDTFVGENGRSLSGGQKQRIAIARALMRHPHITILDEATSALDSESEVVVHDAISRLIEEAKKSETQHTVLMFAHKLSMIRKADHIIVLDKGKVAVEGNFEEVSQSKLFCDLVGLTVLPQAADSKSSA
ncbi:putative mitochondrial ATP-binding cassette protein subfamily B, member 1, putative (ABCB1) [Leptomonas pyrrhocoris]|uniref:Putative mitochondrial ATP-binding cassette protein subfamily B, member 1, putative (ABCB1) n=1 Tax=Leptomonas pyrrhocoris TaxID=157538 RepID=A0A0M9G048_LEPPY|nr:putative mitochondrial ATP-binding cassette protein subfamily B, member 1, putative (ABCB1) [Leptomonas pyrrhocoris]XP_015657897.1 putative mitochondrial ATP-binding cassette protein subfamily B, member 1, putative (ABCB1) [Leptomonas pyrrhocoris]KPA79457.1 putative mitochondrial ATP-binding cassette protein subfamily B, member 1, putative (ABCB1) [Leptomonas pyrrhocoris]KPA79458.1 putative mitochondrial ATP-binding cassette protein subfamily B, member 1, putative (ABCB1) [Leptomonas pyrrhoco|eukprot:XP_015657896.1 putative mitochondrial ATP-binding cassette protein subfamily B, member 1, putative (ABCB1) [Leptomonas pyrrhocoris]